MVNLSEAWLKDASSAPINEMVYIPSDTLSSEDEADLNRAGWVIKSRSMFTVGEAPMETQWTYTLEKAK